MMRVEGRSTGAMTNSATGAVSRPPARTEWLSRPEGRIGYDTTGSGPLVVCVPGMGELRSVYRFTVPVLAAAGFRVVAVDLRGHGDSDATFSAYDDVAAGGDLIALLDTLGPALIVGNSMGAGAAVWAAAERPDLVSGLVLLGPFVRDPSLNPFLAVALRAAMAGPWAPRVWTSHLSTLYPGSRPDDFAEHRRAIAASMRRPGYARAFSRTTRTTHAPVEARLHEVTAPVLVVMGERDPDFSDAPAEGRWIAERLNGQLTVIPGAGHYPHVEDPEQVNAVVVEFASRVTPGA
jgi:pimeloyl-ACP methyl ester carboxylesterase